MAHGKIRSAVETSASGKLNSRFLAAVFRIKSGTRKSPARLPGGAPPARLAHRPAGAPAGAFRWVTRTNPLKCCATNVTVAGSVKRRV